MMIGSVERDDSQVPIPLPPEPPRDRAIEGVDADGKVFDRWEWDGTGWNRGGLIGRPSSWDDIVRAAATWKSMGHDWSLRHVPIEGGNVSDGSEYAYLDEAERRVQNLIVEGRGCGHIPVESLEEIIVEYVRRGEENERLQRVRTAAANYIRECTFVGDTAIPDGKLGEKWRDLFSAL